MKTTRMLAILVLALGMMVWPASVAEGAKYLPVNGHPESVQYLTVNGQPVDSITLGVGQSCTVEVVSNSNARYRYRVGFDNGVVLGTFSHIETRPEAGSAAHVSEYNQPAFSGYYFMAWGIAEFGQTPPSPGVHFVFEYVAQEVGETDLKLYNPLSQSLIDSVHITVVPPQLLRVNGQEFTSITLEQGRSCTVEVVSAVSIPYAGYVGFDNGVVLGIFSHLEIKPEAGSYASVKEYNQPAFSGYSVKASGIADFGGTPPSPGVHFVFQYEAQQVGETDLKLYDKTITSVIDSIQITVIPPQPVPMGTAFTYHGFLRDTDITVDGHYDFEFELYDNPGPYAAQQGNTIGISDFEVIDRHFVVELDFGSDVFNGDARWLRTTIEGVGGNPYTLTTRKELTPVPYALHTLHTHGVFVGDENTFVGRDAGRSNTTGYSNTFLGSLAGNSNTTGNRNTFSGFQAGYSNTTGAGNVFIGYKAGYNETGSNKLYIANSSADPPLIYGDFSTGRVGIGTTNLTEKVNVAGTVKATVFSGDGSGLTNLPTDSDWNISGDNMYSAVSGNVGIGTTSPDEKLKLTVVTSEVDGKAVYGEASYTSDDFHYAPQPRTYGGYFVAEGRVGGIHPMEPVMCPIGTGIYAKGSLWAGHFVGDVRINGDAEIMGDLEIRGGNVIIKNQAGTSTIMELGEGLDYAEGFDVSDNKAISPGSVLIIDPDNPGKLAISNKAYDSKVAGIVAGAKGQDSGVRLGADEFDFDVALAGRVYCNVDATETAVEPGDLLTTSATPGYAMKAADYIRAQGAILGKAMEKLEKGKKGQILVLVTLQ